MSPSSIADAPTGPLCETCGYALRGLAGDERRCPECGDVWTRPAPAAKDPLFARLERPAIALALLVVLGPLLLAIVSGMLGRLIAAGLGLLLLLGWGHLVRETYARRPGRTTASLLVRLHVGVVLRVVGVLLLIGSGILLPYLALMVASSGGLPPWTLVVLPPLLGVICLFGGRHLELAVHARCVEITNASGA